jgi:transketolase
MTVLLERYLRLALKHKSGHVGSVLSVIDILDAIYSFKDVNDIVILSKGHAALGLYVILEKYCLLPKKVLEDYGRSDSILLGHPERNTKYGITATTGSLGHGLPMAVGIANSLSNQRVFCIMGDGECQEGTTWESATLAQRLGTKNLIVIIDNNKFQGLDNTTIITGNNQLDIWKSFGWDVRQCNGHSISELQQHFLQKGTKPIVIVANTIKGNGVSRIQGTLASHYERLKESDL